MGFASDVGCPTVDPVGCAEEDLPDHRQEGRFNWVRALLRASYGFGDGWFVAGSVPVDYRQLHLSTILEDGSPYSPPYLEGYEDGLEKVGIGDVELSGGHVWRWPGEWSVALRLGVSLPTGIVATERFQMGRVGSFQRQFQFGTGSSQPAVAVVVVKGIAPWRVYSSVTTRLSVSPNAFGYQPGTFLGLEAGVSRELGSSWDLLAGLSFGHGEPDRWDDWSYPGSESLDATAAVTRHLGVNWLIEWQVYSQIWETLIGPVGEESNTSSKTQVTMGVSWRN